MVVDLANADLFFNLPYRLHKLDSHTDTVIIVPAWDNGPISYFGIFHDRVLSSRPHFRKLEKFW